MRERSTELTVPDRPSKYLRVALDGDSSICFRLPNEKRQLELLRLVATRAQVGSELQIVGALDVLAVLVGVCWHHPTLALETPTPWLEADAAAGKALKSFVDVPEPLPEEEDEDAWEDRLQEARRAAAEEASQAVLRLYGEVVLDELDEAGFGDRNIVGACFGAISTAIGRNFLPQEVIDERVGFSVAGKALDG